jgi:hypothetical protein
MRGGKQSAKHAEFERIPHLQRVQRCKNQWPAVSKQQALACDVFASVV